MEYPITAIIRQDGLRLFSVHTAELPAPLAQHARMFSYTALGGCGQWRIALTEDCAIRLAAELSACRAQEAHGLWSRITLYGIGIRRQGDIIGRLLAVFRQTGATAELVNASEEGVSFLLPEGVAESMFHRLCRAFPLTVWPDG